MVLPITPITTEGVDWPLVVRKRMFNITLNIIAQHHKLEVDLSRHHLSFFSQQKMLAKGVGFCTFAFISLLKRLVFPKSQ